MTVSDEMLKRATRAVVKHRTHLDAMGAAPTSESLARAALTAVLSDQVVVSGWKDISTAPKNGSFIWLSDGFFMRIGYWHVVTKDPSQEHWADMLRAECGGLGDLQFEPKYWQPTPTAPASPAVEVG